MPARKRQPKFEGELPDGTYTTSSSLYSKRWREFAQPFVDTFGWRPFGYEPGITFLIGRDGGSLKPNEPPAGIFHFPRGIALRIHAILSQGILIPTTNQAPELTEAEIALQEHVRYEQRHPGMISPPMTPLAMELNRLRRQVARLTAIKTRTRRSPR